MSTGSNEYSSVFGVPEGQSGNTPLPSDIARGATATPLPSDAATQGRGRRRGLRRKGTQNDVSAPGQQGNEPPQPRKEPRNDERAPHASMSNELFIDDRTTRHRKLGALTAIVVILTVLSLFVDGGLGGFFDPGEVFASYGLWFQQTIASISSPDQVLSAGDILAQHHAYYRIINRVGITLMTVLCGAVLAIAGSLYQSAFRNPIASPSMLGVSSAIQLGDVIVVMIFGMAAPASLGWRYLICYVCVIVVMTVLFGLSYLMTGKGRPLNVVNLLLTAMILTQIIGVIVTYVTAFVFSWEQWEIYNNLSEALTVNTSAFGWGALLVTCLIGIIPIFLLRFRLNGLNFDDMEMKLLGIDAGRLRLLALICGTILVMGVQVQMGVVAMLALVVPHISRMVFGAEFRKQLAGNVLIGASLLVLCRVILGFIPFISSFLPISVVLNFLVLPFFVWMLATQQRGW